MAHPAWQVGKVGGRDDRAPRVECHAGRSALSVHRGCDLHSPVGFHIARRQVRHPDPKTGPTRPCGGECMTVQKRADEHIKLHRPEFPSLAIGGAIIVPTARGDLIAANAVPGWSLLPLSGVKGSFLYQSNDPIWSTLTMPNTAV